MFDDSGGKAEGPPLLAGLPGVADQTDQTT